MPQLLRRAVFPLGISMLGSLSSCQAVFQGLYGLHGSRPLPPAEIQELARRYRVPAAQLAVLDTSYRQFLAGPLRPEVKKNHYQPLQAAYYAPAGQLQVFYLNCYAGGFPNLTWNQAGSLDRFPPAPQAPVDSALGLPAYLRYLRQPNGQPLPIQPATGYTVVVQWNRLMGRQSRRFIAAIRHNATLAGQPVQLVFVNNDNLLYYLSARAERREALAGK